MITANIVLPSSAALPIVLPGVAEPMNLVFNVTYGFDFAAADFSSDFYITSIF